MISPLITFAFFLPIFMADFEELELTPGFEEGRVVLDELNLEKDEVFELPAFRSVHIRHLVAREGARIRFPVQQSGASAGAGADGGDAGEVRIFVDQLDGHVVIEARGGDGGDGRNGRDGLTGAPGAKGRDAPRLLFFYMGQGETGQVGGPGEDAEDAEDGGDGGDGGHVQVFYVDKTPDSQILVDVSAGRAGAPGRGGRGGLGGPGGPGGYGWPSGLQGPMGPTGRPGAPGRPGRPGQPGRAQVLQVPAAQYQCLVLWSLEVFQWEEELWDCLHE